MLTKIWGADYEDANKRIIEKKNLIDKLIIDANMVGVSDSNKFIKAYLDKKTIEVNKDLQLSSCSVSEIYHKFVEHKKDKLKHKKKKTGIRKYEDLLNRLIEFEREKKEGKKKILQIDLKWRNALYEFLVEEREQIINVVQGEKQFKQIKKRGLSNSTLNSYIYILANFFQWVEYNFMVLLDKEIKNLEVFEQVTAEDNLITPDYDQWTTFKNYVPKTFSEKVCYDLFIFSCYTGMRYSDATTVCYEHLIEENVIHKIAVKTELPFEVRLNHKAKEIFEKYNKDMRQKFPTNQRININLRKIWKNLPGWDVKIKVKKYKLDKEIEVVMPFYQYASFHMSRKIFTTYAIQSGDFTRAEIQKMNGWSGDGRMIKSYYDTVNKTTEERSKKEVNF